MTSVLTGLLLGEGLEWYPNQGVSNSDDGPFGRTVWVRTHQQRRYVSLDGVWVGTNVEWLHEHLFEAWANLRTSCVGGILAWNSLMMDVPIRIQIQNLNLGISKQTLILSRSKKKRLFSSKKCVFHPKNAKFNPKMTFLPQKIEFLAQKCIFTPKMS